MDLLANAIVDRNSLLEAVGNTCVSENLAGAWIDDYGSEKWTISADGSKCMAISDLKTAEC